MVEGITVPDTSAYTDEAVFAAFTPTAIICATEAHVKCTFQGSAN